MEHAEKDASAGGKSRGGRPWSFDRDRAIETAMKLFWRHGYEGVSVSDLTAAIGVAAPSLYAAFGNKAGIYREALDRYETETGHLNFEDVRTKATLHDAIRHILMTAAMTAVCDGRERGCMISIGTIACGLDIDAIRLDLAERRERLRSYYAGLLTHFVEAPRAERLARAVVAVLQGLSVQAKDGATADQLAEIVNDVMAGLGTDAVPAARSETTFGYSAD